MIYTFGVLLLMGSHVFTILAQDDKESIAQSEEESSELETVEEEQEEAEEEEEEEEEEECDCIPLSRPVCGIVIGASLLLVTVQSNPSSHACTSFTELSEPCGCTLSLETFDPTCGSDGHTYLSVCFLECRKAIDKVDISIDYKGVCSKESRCICYAGYAPMCGNNGVTYSNECLLNCFMKKDSRIRLKHQGECGSVVVQVMSDKSHMDTPGTCHCRPKLRIYNTRFGYKGQRYARSCGCRLKNDKRPAAQTTGAVQTVQPASEPDPFALCNFRKKYVNSRLNEDVVRANIVDSKKCACAAMHKPVCGNDRRTYANFCVLYCSSKKNPGIKFRNWGDCSNSH